MLAPTAQLSGEVACATGCRHCGAPLIDARMRETGFCCSGCSYVFRLVHEHGLSGYYRIKDDVTTPADAAVFQARDYSWLETAQRQVEGGGARSPGGPSFPDPIAGPHASLPAGRVQDLAASRPRLAIPELNLDVQGISCAGCVWLIERVFQQQPGARDIVVNAQYGTMRLRWVRGEFSAAEFARKLQAFGYLAGPPGNAPVELESRALAKRIGLCAAFAMNVMLYSLPTYFGMEHTYEWAGLFGVLNVAFGTLSLLVGGLYFLGRAVNAIRERAMHIDLPIAIGITGAYIGSLYGWLAGEERFIYFDFVSTFILLMLIGRWAQVAAVERNRRRLLSQQPRLQRVRVRSAATARAATLERSTVSETAPPAGRYEDIPPEQLRAGQELLLLSGQTLPVESRLESVDATVSLASINGEAEPRIFRHGQRVPAGALNIGRAELRLTALQTWPESLLAQLLRPGDRPGERHRFLEIIVRCYVIGILAVAALSGVCWWAVSGDPLRTWAVVTAVLVVSCPCAIALAFPLADEMATIALRRRGVFVREGDLWSKLSRVRKLVFDKTGTLTLETPVLKNPVALAALDATARAALLALVRDNSHPISQCLHENLLAAGATTADEPPAVPAGDIREDIGYGIELGPWSLGRPGWRSTAPDECHLLNDTLPGRTSAQPRSATGKCHLIDDTLPGSHGTEFARDGEVLARFHFVDTARSDAREELAALGRRGFDTFILSGDRREKVKQLAQELGLREDHALGELSPKAKAGWLQAHRADDAMMLGDGANDSLAFDCALCRGTPVIHRGVLERKADFYYLGRGIAGLRALFDVDVIRRRTQMAILVFSVTYNVLAVGLAVAGHMNPLLAAALMPINSLITLALVTGGMRGAFRKERHLG